MLKKTSLDASTNRPKKPRLIYGVMLSIGLSLSSVMTNATSLPEIAGSTAGEFRVDESGAATYSIPLTLPPGIAGLTPQLALNYNSRAGIGHLGKGWSLSGLSAISRCKPTIEEDGYSSNKLEKFCFDGQKLISVNGEYGAPGTEYRTEINNQIKVISHGEYSGFPEWFEVRAKDGSVSEYGKSIDSRAYASHVSFVEKKAPITWAVNKIQDNLQNTNNEITFRYEHYSRV